MRRFKANRPCAISAGAEAAAIDNSADLKIERLLMRNKSFRVRNAYFFAFIFTCSSKDYVKSRGRIHNFGRQIGSADIP